MTNQYVDKHPNKIKDKDAYVDSGRVNVAPEDVPLPPIYIFPVTRPSIPE